MSLAAEKINILVVETATAMLDVLKNFSSRHGYDSDNFADPALACTALTDQSGEGYRCVLLGWPEGSPAIINDLLGVLASTDFQDLPLLILCQEVTSDIEEFVNNRTETTTVLWKNFQVDSDLVELSVLALEDDQASDVIEQTALATAAVATSSMQNTKVEIKALLVENSPSASRALHDLMESNGYQVTVANSVAGGRKAIEEREFDLVVTDFFLRGEGGEELCRFLQSAENLPGVKPVCVMISSKYSEAIAKRSVAAGAVSCLFKDESIESLFARIDKLARMTPESTLVSGDDESLVDSLELANDPAILIDHEGLIVGLNQKGSRLLNGSNGQGIIGQKFSSVVHKAPISMEKKQTAQFLSASDRRFSVSYMAQHVALKGGDSGVLLTFTPTPQPVGLTKATLANASIVQQPLVESDSATVASSVVVDLDDTVALDIGHTEVETDLELIANSVEPDAIATGKKTNVIPMAPPRMNDEATTEVSVPVDLDDTVVLDTDHIQVQAPSEIVVANVEPEVRVAVKETNVIPIVSSRVKDEKAAAVSEIVDLDDTVALNTDHLEAKTSAEVTVEKIGLDDGVTVKETNMTPIASARLKGDAGTAIEEFTESLNLAIASGAGGPRHSVLMLDIELIASTGDRLNLGDSEPMLEIVNEALGKLYSRDKSFAYLGDGQFGFLLASRRKQDALELTQKLLLVVPKLVKYLNNLVLVSHGAVLQLSAETPHDVDQVLSKCRRACARARKDNRDNAALVMPMNKYLSAKSATSQYSNRKLEAAK